VTNADAITEEYLTRGIGQLEQYRTVYSGINLDQFHNVTPAADITDAGVRVVMVSRLADGKGFDDLLAAINLLSHNDLSVYLVGDGPLREQVQKEIDRSGLSEKVHMLGYRSDIPAILSACDIFVLPSYREGTPRVITEAMASGLPVIATDIAGIPEQVADRESGFLIEPGDVDALVNRLDRLASLESLRREFGTAGRERAARFSKERMLADLKGVYEELLDGQ